MKKCLLSALMAVGLCAYASDDFAKAVTFTTSGYQGSAALANFPVLVKLSTSIEGFDYADFGGGRNIVFKDSAGNEIPHEIDTWDTSGTSLVWVKVPSLTAETTFTMFYCGSTASDIAPSCTWSGANYVGVWHMDEENGTVADASGHGLVATPTPDGGASASVRYSGVDAPVGYARQTGTSSTKCYLSVQSYDSLNVGDTFTMSGWVRLTENVANNPRLFSRKDTYNSSNGWEIEMGTASPANFNVRGAARDKDQCKGSFSPNLQNRWTHVAFVYDGSTCSVYSNGYLLVSGTVTPATDNGLPLSIGCDSDGSEANVRGAFDECRLMDAVASADWIAAEYATVAEGDFVTAGAVVDVAPVLGEVSVRSAITGATIFGAIASLGSDATACDVYLAVGPTSGGFGASKKIASGITASFSYVMSGLAAETSYAYLLSVSNNAASARGSSVGGAFTTKHDIGTFSRKVTFTIGYDGEDPLSGVPVLVKLSEDSPVGFRYSDCATGGSDIRFLDVDSNAIPFEIDTWDTSGESLIWVKVPSVVQGATFTMFYKGTPAVGNNPQDVWTGYTGVWHLNDLAADETEFSQGLYSNSTATNGIDGHLSSKSVSGETGMFGKSFRVNDSTGSNAGNYNEGGVWVNDSGENSPLDAGGVFTISGWFKHANWNYNWDKLFFKRMNENNDSDPTGSFVSLIGSQVKETKVSVRGASSANRVRLENASEMREDMVDNWVYLTIVFNDGNCSIYENGVLCKSGLLTGAADNDAPLVFGNNVAIASGLTGQQAWNGWIDEVRFLKGAKSAAWIAAEYAAMAGETFLAAGAVEKTQSGFCIIVR